MRKKIEENIRKKQMIEPGDYVLAAVSGGADSVCLLLILNELRHMFPFSLGVIHIEHGIRGDESKADARFVKELAAGLGLPCDIYSENIPRYAAESGVGLEEAARNLRYRRFAEAAEKIRAAGGVETVRIALAHHADDNAETVLFRLARGSSVKGLGGMREMRSFGRECIIRPLLYVTRGEIERYLSGRGQAYRTDSTNESVEYSRNRIRHVVLPELAKINDRAAVHISRSAAEFSEFAEYLAEQADSVINHHVKRTEGGCTLFSSMLEEPAFLRREAVHRILEETAGSAKDLTDTHLRMVLSLFELQVGRRVHLPYRMVAERVREGVFLCRSSDEKAENILKSNASSKDIVISENRRARLEAGETLVIPVEGAVFLINVFNKPENWEILKNEYTKFLNYDIIKDSLIFRRRLPGDYLAIDDALHTKKLKKWFVEQKIPVAERDKIWLLAEGAHILWIVGWRISSAMKVRRDTKRILRIEMRKQGGDE